MTKTKQVTLLVILVFSVLATASAKAWNIPGHMLSAAIAYQVLRQESPKTIENVKAVLEKHPWNATQWHARLQDVPVAERDQVLFMQAARWADDIRTQDRARNTSTAEDFSGCTESMERSAISLNRGS